MAFTLDVTSMTEPVVPAGVRDAEWATLDGRFRAAHGSVVATAATGVYGYRELEAQRAERTRVINFAGRVQGQYDDVVVLGIGGSSLGAMALRTALLPPAWNARTLEQRGGRSRLHVLDNVDPRTIAGVLSVVALPRTIFVVISKSGGTIETLAQYLIVRDRLAQAGLDVAAHLVFVTDPAKGALRAIARRDGIPAFEVPPSVGGRFSVLSPVGLLPAALVGIDIAALLGGAERALRDADSADLLTNRPALHAALHWAADTWLGARIDVLMPYCDRLRDVAEWYRQLWAESLGKRRDRRGAEVFAGPTPVGAVGATDQHSQVQLFMEGPFDKVLTLVSVEDHGLEVVIPGRSDLPDELSYLPGRSLNELLAAECAATSGALASAGRMHTVLRVPEVSEDSLGELLMFYQLATGFAGAWYGVNPFDQPGVELGKQLTFAAMGRAGTGSVPTPPADPGDFA